MTDTFHVDLEYPRIKPVKYVVVDLLDVRAAPGLRLSYDFDRDGWVVEKSEGDGWVIAAFIPAQGFAGITPAAGIR